MFIDFHTHAKLAKKLPFSTIYTDWLLNEANNAGLDVICVTEHFNTLHFEEMYRYICSISKREGDTLKMKNGLSLFMGMETDIAEGGHILSIGTLESILELNNRLEPFKEKDKYLPFSDLMKLFREYSVLVGAAHPFREGSNIPELPLEQLSKLDFLDLNGKDIALDRQRTEQLTDKLAKQIDRPVVAGSDTHQAVQFGCIVNKFEKNCITLKDLKQEIIAGNYEIQVRSNASLLVNTAGLLKRTLKEIYALGGDYVSALVGTKNV
ncbi:PHP-associated domain-containing protein [Anaerosacchariphilus polymeriproducens]|uniref:PHP domain-containing protein n=1 Tax=Anaerosacchariphilus polymeriproducens TaxID=1812858 RepID=A0A371AZG3_9FIRM|nr:PHP-associated domain-containing protein [Anaerosacchariphilus polymeriproducens]RDU24946.1 hypothetical protein DWV06_01585 [Anaerosacchariphilus polymeriproducens]